MATGSSGLTEVEIESETYSLLSVPEASSALVQRERDNLASNVDLEKFVKSMENVGMLLKVAYNAVNAAGPQFVNIQIGVQRLGFDITRLCNESSITIEKFRAAAATASSDLISIYHFLLDGFEDIAIKSLSSLGELAEEMTKLAQELEKKFKKQAEKVQETMETTKKEKSKQAEEKEKLQQKWKKIEEKSQSYRSLVDEQYKLAEEAKKERIESEENEEKELSKGGIRSDLIELVGISVSALPWAGDAVTKLITHKSARLREIVQEKIEVELKKEKQYFESLQKMYEFAEKIPDIHVQQDEMSDLAINAMHEAAEPLVVLSLIMEEAVKFWSYIQDHCKKMATTHILEKIDKYSAKDEAIKKRLWNYSEFIKNGVSYHAQWISLRDLCEKHGRKIEKTRSGLYSFLRENPTYSESKDCLGRLTADFKQAIERGKEITASKINEKERALAKCKNN